MSVDKTVVVSTWHDCEWKMTDFSSKIYNPVWRHNMIGCFLIEIMKSMYGLNVTYLNEKHNTFQKNRTPEVDIYALPMILSPETLKLGHPIQVVIHARYGFLIRRPHDLDLLNFYYLKPFTNPLWRLLLLLGLVVCCVFFLMAWWEKKCVGRRVECSVWHEILLVIGGYCQHIPPVETIFCSRRAAYFTFFLYSYIIYTMYTSNLLSHLVSDKERDIGLEHLEKDHFEFAILDNMKHVLANDYISSNSRHLYSRLTDSEALPVTPAVQAVKWNRTALFSDYITIYSKVQSEFSEAEICELIEVDLNSDVRKYLFASARFQHREKLKIGALRMKEAGILKKLTFYDSYHPLICETVQYQVVEIEQIFTPLMILMAAISVSFIIMILEREYYRRTVVWPYVN